MSKPPPEKRWFVVYIRFFNMAESVVKLRVDSKEYESKIKRAADGVRAFGESCRKSGESVSKADKDTLDYVRAIGQMETVSKNAKGKVNEMTSAFTELSVQYRHLTDQEKQSQFGKALAQSLDQLKGRLNSTKAEIASINEELGKKQVEMPSSGGGLFGGGKLGGMMQVFGGNMMTKAVGWASGFATELSDCVQQGIELARAGEGVRLAFEKLNRPDLLDQLREATHGTVTDLELMKQAVKFNDFNLSLEELGTMLAFAQQKAKDTGQSVDYMVDSIVTGLGRKSLMILDNLGLSANEIKEKMKGTGDMTKAVGEIIRDQMSKAGDYIETAADRAAKADAEVKNAMEELGRTFQPLSDAGSTLWHNLKVGALDFLNSALKPIIDTFTQIGRLRKQYENAGGSTRVGTDLDKLKNNPSGSAYGVLLSPYNDEIRNRQRALDAWDAWRKGDRSAKAESEMQWAKANYGTNNSAINAELGAWKKMRDEFVAGAKDIMTPVAEVPTVTIPTGSGGGGKVGRVNTGRVGAAVAPPPPEGSIAAQEAKVQALTKAWRNAATEAGRAGYLGQLEEARKVLSEMQGKGETIPEGSLKDLNNQMQELQKQRELLADPIDISLLDDDIQRIKDKIDELNGVVKKDTTSAPMPLEDKIRMSVADSITALDETTLTNLMEFKIRNGLENLDIKSEYLQQAIFGERMDIPDEYWQSLADEINAKLAELGVEPIIIDVKTGEVTQAAKQAKEGWQDAAKAVQAVGGALQQLEDPGAKIMGIIGEAVANIALGFAQATAASSSAGVFGWIAAIAGGLGTMISTINAIHSATGYSEGGIIKGNTYSGDNIMANGGTIGLNAGEIVLNRAQAGVLASQLNDTNAIGDRRPYIESETIWLGLKHYLNRNGMGEIVTSKR